MAWRSAGTEDAKLSKLVAVEDTLMLANDYEFYHLCHLQISSDIAAAGLWACLFGACEMCVL